MAEQSFKQAFAEARKKFRSEPTEANYTFTWPKGEGGKKYNILQKGETKKSVMEKYGKSPDKSPRPKARPSKSESSGSSSSGPKKRLGDETKDTTDDARASRGSGRTSDKPKRTPSSSGPSTRPNNKPEDSRTQLEKDRDAVRGRLKKVGDFLFGERNTDEKDRRGRSKMYKGGMVGASNPPTQKGTPRYKK